ncbi:MAG: HAD family phosphatase [Phycisphaerae bacterium]|nr:HAD family phosphatase [Phycisphaerae bacterium]
MTNKAVIFDMDGLIMDSERVARLCWQRAANDMGYHIDDITFDNMTGANAHGVSLVLFDALGADLDYQNLKSTASSYIFDYVDNPGIPIKSGFAELMEFIKANDIPCALATSTYRQMAIYKLKASDIVDDFDAIICGDQVEKSKPAPDIFLKAASMLAIDPQDCIVLEDSANGIKAAKAAGMKAIMIPDLVKPTDEIMALTDMILTNLKEVIELLSD